MSPTGRAWLHELCERPGTGWSIPWYKWHGVITKSTGTVATTTGSAPVEVLLCERDGRPWAASLSPADPDTVFDRASVRGRWELGLRDPFEPKPHTVIVVDPVLEVTLSDGEVKRLEPDRSFFEAPTDLDCTAPKDA